MKIGIDASQIVFGTGVSFYTSNLLQGLSEINSQDEFIVFASSLRARSQLKKKIRDLNLGNNFKKKILLFPPAFFEFFWNKIHLIKVENFIGKVDVFHASDWTQPPAKKAKLVTTIHDLAVLKYPQYFPSRILRNQKLRLKWIKKEADVIIAVSQATKKDIIELLKINPQKIHVIHEAVPLEHQIKITKNDVEEIKRKYDLQDYILCLGTREPRKNFPRVVKAFQKVQGLKLVIVGKKGWRRDIKDSDLKSQMSKVKFIENANDKDLSALYAGAKCFVYPSLYEGFGLPVLEAMYHGCPVITSNVSSLPEVAGEAALLVDPESVNEISQAINKVINNPSIYSKLREKGLTRVKSFSWQKTAKKTLEVYKSLIINN